MNDNLFVFQEFPATASSLRVAVVTETYPPEVNGVAMTLARIVDGLQRRNHRIQLIRPRQHATEIPALNVHLEEILSRGVPIPRYQELRIGLPTKQALFRLWSLKRPGIVHIATEGPLGWSPLVAAIKLKLPVSTGFHTNFHSYSKRYGVGFLKKPIAAYLRKFHNKAQATLVPTEDLRRELAASGFENLRVVSRGVDTRLFSPARRSAQLRRDWGAAGGAGSALCRQDRAGEESQTGGGRILRHARARPASAPGHGRGRPGTDRACRRSRTRRLLAGAGARKRRAHRLGQRVRRFRSGVARRDAVAGGKQCLGRSPVTSGWNQPSS